MINMIGIKQLHHENLVIMSEITSYFSRKDPETQRGNAHVILPLRVLGSWREEKDVV